MSSALPLPCSNPPVPLTRTMRDFLIGAWLCVATLALLLPTSDQLLHWFVLPVTLCGVLITGDAIAWLQGRLDRFDCRGLIGLLGFHFFFLAPLLQVSRNYFMQEVAPPPDWREWLGFMAILNALGLVVYRVGMRVADRRPPAQADRIWVLNERRFFLLVGLALPATALLQVYAYAQYGGILGYVEAATQRTFRNSMPGMGPLFMFSESFPILAMMAFAVFARKRAWGRSWVVLGLVLAVFFVLAMLFGGLRGNRSHTVWNLFWAVAIIHFYLRRIPLQIIAGGVALLVLFMYTYGLFKAAGTNIVDVLQNEEATELTAQKSGRTVNTVLLEDFGRSDVHAFLLYRLMMPNSDYHYALGRTYLGAAVILVPKALWPSRPAAAGQEGTEAQFGAGSHDPLYSESPRVYGLAGEAMLNFGPLAVPAAFLVWTLAVLRARRPLLAWNPGDARFLLYPLVVVLAFTALFQDAENLVFFLFKYGLVPFCVTMPAMTIIPLAHASRAGWGTGPRVSA
jgi:hypothetical protein